MDHHALLNRTELFVKDALKNAEKGHNWFHINRVRTSALEIAKHEHSNILVVELAALLHDIGDSKFHNGDESEGPKQVGKFLNEQPIEPNVTEHIIAIIKNMSFKNSLDTSSTCFKSIEMDIVQDADRLDAIGAIGIARAFHYGGFKDREIYDPEIKPNLHISKDEYKNSTAPTINHFYEKLLRIKESLNTSYAKKIAEERHLFMLKFLEQFYKEWNGLD